MGHVHADLVRSPGIQHALQQGMAPKPLAHAIVGTRLASARADRLPQPIDRMAAQWGIDRAPGDHLAANQREVLPMHRAGPDHANQRSMSAQRSRHQHQARGVLVQSMHDPGTRKRRQTGIEMQEGVLQRSCRLARTRMHHEASGLVEHEEVGIRVHDLERDGFGRILHERFRPRIQVNPLATVDAMARFANRTVEVHTTGTHPGHEACARVLREQACQDLVEPASGGVQRHLGLPGMIHGRHPFPLNAGLRQDSATLGALPRPWVVCMRSIRLLPILILLLALPACSLFHGKRVNLDTLSVEALYTRANTALKDGNYGAAEQLYDKLIARFPYGDYTEHAQINLAYAQFKDDKPDDAYASVNRFIKTYPASNDIAYAYYLRGLINFNRSGGLLSRLFPVDRTKRDQGYAVQSFDDFSLLLQRFPASRYARDARQRMIWLRNGLAQFEMNIAFYYYDREAYVAALDRAKYVVDHYQQAPQTGDALALMVQCYKKLHDATMENQALAVLKLNYPDHPYFNSPGSWPHYRSDLWRLIPFAGGFGITDSGVKAATPK